MLDKFVPKIPAYALYYWDSFTGLCLFLVGLGGFAGLLEKLPHPVGVMLLGIAANGFAMMRKSIRYIGDVRRHRERYWRQVLRETYPALGAVGFWAVFAWGFLRYAAINFQITEGWIKWALHY